MRDICLGVSGRGWAGMRATAFAAALTDVCVHPVCVEKAIEMRGGRASASIWSKDTAAVLFVKEMEEFEGGKEGIEEGEGEGEGEKEREREKERQARKLGLELNGLGKRVEMKQVVVQEFVYDVSEEWEVNEEGRKARKYVEWEKMRAGRVYVCDVVLTNTTAAQRSVEVLMQVPGGSIVLQRGSATRTQSVVLGAYGTQTVSYAFYFPEGGEFVHYPAQVAMRGRYVCCSREGGHRVRVEAEGRALEAERRDWGYVSQEAKKEVLLEFLEKENLHRADVDLSMILWRLEEKSVFESVIEVLLRRGVYDERVYSYSLRHFGPAAAVQRHLCGGSASSVIASRLAGCATVLSPVCVKSPALKGEVRVLEYRPLINPRCFVFGKEKERIANTQLAGQYRKYLMHLAHGAAAGYVSSALLERNEEDEESDGGEYNEYSQRMPSMSGSCLIGDGERLVLTYYLLLQDRLDEARELFGMIGKGCSSASGSDGGKRENEIEMEMQLQYDYMSAYLDMTDPESALPKPKSGENGEMKMEAPKLAVARRVAEKHWNCSIPRWKAMFDHLKEQIGEVDRMFGAGQREREKERREEEEEEEKEKEVKGGGKRKKDVFVENEAERENRRQRQLDSSMAVEGTFGMEIDEKGKRIVVKQEKGKEKRGKMKFYKVDVESLFSVKPFMKGKDAAKAFSIVKPTKQIEFSFEEATSSFSSSSSSSLIHLMPSVIVPVPEELQTQNVFVEAEYEGKSCSEAPFRSGMSVEVFEETGRLVVKEEATHLPAAGVYVKVYAKVCGRGGREEEGVFVKDGFTDWRGCFDYASVNKSTNSSLGACGRASCESTRRFSILIASDDLGCVVKEADAPAEN
ncbi:putative ATP-dependent RNA helicase RhlE [Monocercomonoides exilis]|uniref:putative ATP-dependent RNA helicase RhlE n=1 Tax=Monocercomonoides exilis TaxID=2049356 RepID=UPI003559CA08|nr:putative ATP-dependent RNA helicase RhlE [Monocercomonoides exilis]|eukprot:MONOS_11955.1-p1 / transcript=MONOS_11955.1 / gene=MONOS_11955 / organism=Monocercomonoides_exilis_PA203 / gene_product=ATP-dependent RNA helicase RhlE / transcript_product=ATP-dependent RNA helicase RhlE / location=Mono_scaffold00630:13618-16253(-) / protein_length=856 / sequence_SO=supercontig / SO=protein_coding / is_pseudo=false